MSRDDDFMHRKLPILSPDSEVRELRRPKEAGSQLASNQPKLCVDCLLLQLQRLKWSGVRHVEDD